MDERKRAANLAKHGVDFELAKLIFEDLPWKDRTTAATMASRASAPSGMAKGIVLFVVYTWRGRRRRLISARKAGKHEQETYASRIAALPGTPEERDQDEG